MTMIDETLFRRTFIRLLRMHMEMGATLAAMGDVLSQDDKTLEGRIGIKRDALIRNADRVVGLFEAAQTTEWIAMLDKLDGPKH